MTTTVWLIETGEYAQRDVFGVASSLDAAVAYVKRAYGPPYVVEWEDVEQDEWQKEHNWWTLVGNFEGVQGYSTRHRGVYDISPWPVSVDAYAAASGEPPTNPPEGAQATEHPDSSAGSLVGL